MSKYDIEAGIKETNNDNWNDYKSLYSIADSSYNNAISEMNTAKTNMDNAYDNLTVASNNLNSLLTDKTIAYNNLIAEEEDMDNKETLKIICLNK